MFLQVLLLLYLVPAVNSVLLLARSTRSISLLQIDVDRRIVNGSQSLFKPLREELPVFLAVDERKNIGYFTLHQHLRRIYLDGTKEASNHVLRGVLEDTPTSIAYDWLTQKIYVAISTIGPDNSARIEVCDEPSEDESYRSTCAVILHDKLDHLHSLVLDPVEGNMYWINSALNQIERAFMNGMHHDKNPFQNPDSSETATLTALTLSREAMSLFYVRTIKEGSEIWQCRLYERESCGMLTESKNIMHLGVINNFLFLSIERGQLEMCDWTNCKTTKVAIGNATDIESFVVIDPTRINDTTTNPCDDSNGGCSHLCLVGQIAPPRTCACPVGIMLKEDGLTCEDGPKEVLLISSVTGLFFISLDTPDYTPQSIPYEGHEDELSSHRLFDVDYDPIEKYVYWLDLKDCTIRRCHMYGTNMSIVASEGVSQNTKTFRLDYIGRNIFWADGATALVWVAKMDGSVRPRILCSHPSLENPHGLAVDPYNGLLYITDWTERHSAILRMNMDGTNLQKVYSLSDYSYPTGIELDMDDGRIYWAESNHSLIRSIRLDGTDLLTYMQSTNKLVQPYSVSKIGNRIYCNSMAGRSFVVITLRSGILQGHDSSRMVESPIPGPMGLKAIQMNATPDIRGPCARNNAGCSQYCLTTSSSTAQCACGRGYELSLDGKGCSIPPAFALLLNQSIPTDVQRMALKGNKNLERLYLTGAHPEIIQITVDPYSDTLYTLSRNASAGIIQRVSLNYSKLKMETVMEGIVLRGASSLSVDPITKNIYWNNPMYGRVEVVDSSGEHRRTIAWENIHPTVMVLSVQLKRIFIVNESPSGNNTIHSMAFHGDRSGGYIVASTTARIVAITVEQKGEHIFWIEQRDDECTLKKARTNERTMVVLHRSIDRRLTSLSHLDHHLYYVDSKREEFGYYDSRGFHSIHAGLKGATAMTITHRPGPLKGSEACSKRNGGCQHLCFPSEVSSAESSCACRDHFILNERSCTAPTNGAIIATKDKMLRLNARPSSNGLDVDQDAVIVLPVERVGLPLSVALDPVPRPATLFWIDGNDPRYIKVTNAESVRPSFPTLLSITDCSQLRSLAIHSLGRQLFVSCANGGKNHILALRILDSTNSITLQLIGRIVDGEENSLLTGYRPNPTELAVVDRRLAYLDAGVRSDRPMLIVCNLDGRECVRSSEQTHPLSRLGSLPTVPILYYSGDSSISALDPLSLKPLLTLRSPQAQVSKVLFAPLDESVIAYSQIDEQGDHTIHVGDRAVHIPGQERITAMAPAVAADRSLRDKASKCIRSECTHICSPLISSYECFCPLGFTMSTETPFVCLRNVTCAPWEFLCGDQRTCVHMGKKCDERLDCPDGSDESKSSCDGVSPGTWRCASGGLAIDRFLVCDGVEHCDDGSDEHGCKCAVPSVEMDCALWGRIEGECIQRRLRCDRHVECSNGADEDERLCNTFPTDSSAAQLSFRHLVYAALGIMVILTALPLIIFICARSKSNQPQSTLAQDRRYTSAAQADRSVLMPLTHEQTENYELAVRAYSSLAGSTTTYPSLPPPIPSLSGCSAIQYGNGQRLPLRRSPAEHPISTFYAPPPSAASLSTYGVVAPAMVNKIMIDRHRTPSGARSNQLLYETSPPPAYTQGSSNRGASISSPYNMRSRPRPKPPSHSSSSSANPRQKPMKRKDPTPSKESSSEDSISLSSHSSDARGHSTRQL